MTQKAGADKTEVDVLNEVNRVYMTKESRDRMSLNIYDLQYLVRLQDMSNDAFREELKELLIKDSEVLSEKISVYVCGQVAEVIKPIWGKLEDLAVGQEEIKTTVSEIRGELKEVRDRVFITDADRFDKIDKALNPWSLRNVLLKTGVIVTSVLLALILFFLILNSRLGPIEKLITNHIKVEVPK